MDQDTVVSERTESGKQLISALAAEGFEVRLAFWAKPTEEGKWYLYLVSPVVDEKGSLPAYHFVFGVLRKTPNLWIEPLEVKVIGLNDSLAEAAMSVIEPKIPDSPFAVRNPKPYPGMTRYEGSNLGGLDIDGAYIYPPRRGVSV